MTASSTANMLSTEPTDNPRRTSPTSYRGIAALLALIAIAVVIGVVDLLLQGRVPSLSAAVASWSWVFNVILVVLAIVIVLWVVRLVFWGVGAAPHSESRERRHRRREYAGPVSDRDPAIEIARERFARGEISQEQLNQTLRQLSKGE